MALHVPPNNQDWKEEGEEVTPGGNAAKSLLDTLMVHTDADAARSEDAVVIFEDVAVMAPRGRFEVEMHNSHFKMVGQTNDFKIRYTSIVRIWVLPKSATPHTLVVVSLDPPIRKGQTYYSHLLCQFSSTDEISLDLEISDEHWQPRMRSVAASWPKPCQALSTTSSHGPYLVSQAPRSPVQTPASIPMLLAMVWAYAAATRQMMGTCTP